MDKAKKLKNLKIKCLYEKGIEDPKAVGKLMIQIGDLCIGHTYEEIAMALELVLHNVKINAVFQEGFTELGV